MANILIPIAVSSQLDSSGEERIHAAGYTIGSRAILPLNITGDIGDGQVGDVLTGSYTAVGGIPPYSFNITNGSLPSGLSLNEDGSYSGTLSANGNYAWTVQVTDNTEATASLNDSDTVTIIGWWLVRSSDASTIYVADDPTTGDWQAVTRSPTGGSVYRPISTGLGKAIIVPYVSSSSTIFATSDVDPVGNIVGANLTTSSFQNFYVSDDGIVTGANTSSGVGTYYVSTNGGTSFAAYSKPNNSFSVNYPVKLGNRWILVYRNTSSQAIPAYTDLGTPAVSPSDWINGSRIGTGTISWPGAIACNGSAATFCVSNGDVYRTTNGISWNKVYSTGLSTSDSRTAFANGNLFIHSLDQNGTILISLDAGLTFTQVDIGSNTPVGFAYYDGILVATFVAGSAPRYSTYPYTVWNNIPLPVTVGTAGVGVGYVIA